eukprot:m.148558 g.148558  ORF g.148558 m.148558 type:complete len:215 (+) comp15000_c0_seq11:255-899(+)
MMAAASDNLECKIGCHEGLDVGNGVDRFGLRYTYQGNVYNNRAHGVGVLTYEDGDQYLGPFEHGTISGGIAFYHKLSNMYMIKEGDPNRLFRNVEFNRRNPIHVNTVQTALESASLAQRMVDQPWSRTINHFNKYRNSQGLIFTILLCGERLQQRMNHVSQTCAAVGILTFCKVSKLYDMQIFHAGNVLEPLPSELWELIISYFMQQEFQPPIE